MPQVMEADAGQGGLARNAHPLMGDRLRLQGRSIRLGHDEAVLVEPDAYWDMRQVAREQKAKGRITLPP